MFQSKLFPNIDAKADHSEKMTMDMIKRIVGGKESLYALSKELGCSYSYLRLIKQGKIYKTQVAEALKELNLPSAEIHTHDASLPSPHIAPTANTPQHSVDISMYENPSNILELIKESPKFKDLSVWEGSIARKSGTFHGKNGRTSIRRFYHPESYVPREVKINKKQTLMNGGLALDLLISYMTNREEKENLYSHYIMKGTFEIAAVKGKVSIIQKGKLDIEGYGAENHENAFKSEAEKADISNLDNEIAKYNIKILKTLSYKAEVEKMAHEVIKGLKYNVKSVELKWNPSNEGFEVILVTPDDKQISYYNSGNVYINAQYDNGESASIPLNNANRSPEWGNNSARKKLVSVKLDKIKTLEQVRNCVNEVVAKALKEHRLAEKSNGHAEQKLTEAFHHFMSQAHWTSIEAHSEKIHGGYEITIKEQAPYQMGALLNGASYSQFKNLKFFKIMLRNGEPTFLLKDGGSLDSSILLRQLDSFDKLAVLNLKKQEGNSDALKKEAERLKSEVESIVHPVKGTVSFTCHEKEAEIYAAIPVPKDTKGYRLPSFPAVVRMETTNTGNISFWYREKREGFKKITKANALHALKELVKSVE